MRDLGLEPIAPQLEWLHPLLSGPFARPIQKLATELGVTEFDTEHKVLSLRRRDVMRLIPGELWLVEIYVSATRPPRIYLEYAGPTDQTFRGSGLRPLTLKGLRRALRDARRVPG